MWREFTPRGRCVTATSSKPSCGSAHVCPPHPGRIALHDRRGRRGYNLYRTARQGVFIAGRTGPGRPFTTHRAQGADTVASRARIEAASVRRAAFVTVAIGGVVEFVPTALVRSNVPYDRLRQPYTPLELEGRDLYIREGCVGCHSQMVRPLRAETERYGDYSKAGRVRLRPSVPLGLETDGAGSPSRRREVPGLVAFRPHEGATRVTSPGSPSCLATRGLYTDTLDTSHTRARSSRCGDSACRIRPATNAGRSRLERPGAGDRASGSRAAVSASRRTGRSSASSRTCSGLGPISGRRRTGRGGSTGGHECTRKFCSASAASRVPGDFAGAVRRGFQRDAGPGRDDGRCRRQAIGGIAAGRQHDPGESVHGGARAHADRARAATSCSITTRTASANSTTRCRAGGCTAST